MIINKLKLDKLTELTSTVHSRQSAGYTGERGGGRLSVLRDMFLLDQLPSIPDGAPQKKVADAVCCRSRDNIFTRSRYFRRSGDQASTQ